MNATNEQIESMKNFIFDVMEDWQEGGGIEGYDLQEIAEKHGILIPHTVYAPCGDYCNCVECYNDDEFRGGVPCYNFPDWLTRAAELPLEPSAQHSGGLTLRLIRMVNSLGNIIVDSFGKGYIAENDLNQANDYLDEVIPLLPPHNR